MVSIAWSVGQSERVISAFREWSTQPKGIPLDYFLKWYQLFTYASWCKNKLLVFVEFVKRAQRWNHELQLKKTLLFPEKRKEADAEFDKFLNFTKSPC